MELTLERPVGRISLTKIFPVSLLFLLLLFAFPLLTSLAEGPAPTPTYSETEHTLFVRINEIRAQYGLPALQWSEQLGQAADGHVYDMQSNGNRSHRGTDGSTYYQRISRAGYPVVNANEAIGWGYNMDRQINWWMNSPVHRGIILSSKYTDIGIGYLGDGRSYGNWWVMNFASK